MAQPPIPRRNRISIVLARPMLFVFPSAWRAAALIAAELAVLGLIAPGVAEEAIGPTAPWFLLVAVLLGVVLRAVSLECCALFVPGGLYGTVKASLGKAAARVAAAGMLAEQLIFGALSVLVAGHYVTAIARASVGEWQIPRIILVEDLSTAFAFVAIGAIWWWQRQGRSTSRRWLVRAVAASAAVLGLVLLAAFVTALRGGVARSHVPWIVGAGMSPTRALAALGFCLFALGSVESLARLAPELRHPRIHRLERAAFIVGIFAILAIAGGSFLFAADVPPLAREIWREAPMLGLAWYVRLPLWIRIPLGFGVVLATLVLCAAAASRATTAAQASLLRLADEGVVPRGFQALHVRFGTPSHVIDLVAFAQAIIIMASAGRIAWLARAYAVGVVVAALLETAALVAFRQMRREAPAFKVPLNIRIAGREWPIAVVLIGLVLAVSEGFALASGDWATISGAAFTITLTLALLTSERAVARSGIEPTSADEFELLPDVGLDIGQVQARPGNLLVPVRKPHFLAHLTAALDAAGDRDVVVMTVRLLGIDVPDDLSRHERPTDEEQRLFSVVAAMAERRGRAVRLLIVPGTNVFDAITETADRLRSSEIYVGESQTLSVDDQARLLGEAWERGPRTAQSEIRLIVHHRSGRTASYQIGAHAPVLDPEDLRLLHSLWLDIVKDVGTHVHHRDVVRAALKFMEEKLNTPERGAALEAVREVARPAADLAAVAHARDFARMRDMLRNRPATELARLITDLDIEDQVVVFRTLPRNVAAATFEYLSRESQETLLKAMAQEDVAALLNAMAPDDRTMFLEELPASATRQLLALLKPEERAVAATLLGYPEGSIGRRMTPDYIAVREHWTVQEVLDYVREHGRDSETLNVIYVVDDRGTLIDDVRIREFLLAPLTAKVTDLMDRRFVALKAADAQETAVAVFRNEDRSALPVTDSAGALIGIVTVDDVLDVAEEAATKDIQRLGGSEALDEPYTEIAFAQMIRKRAGWLTVLFLGEMLTATAMGFFEREIQRAVVLALFVPLIISSGGNSGSQASSLVIRAMALGELKLIDWWRVMRREAAAGFALGAILGSIGFVRITLWSAVSNLYGPHWLLVALTVATALIGVVLWGTLIGSLLPFALRRLGFDPATSSAPFVATLVDVTGLVIYFCVGLVLLRGTLL